MLLSRIEAAYWLTLTFRLEGERRRERNGLVLTASRRLGLGLLDLVQMDIAALPEALVRFRPTLERLQGADGEVSGMAFLVDELAERGVALLPITHPAYPAHLGRTLKPDAAPTLLSACGDVRLLAEPGVCVSGSRKAGVAGNAFARAFGEALAAAGVTVVTGLAAGPDREALSGSLDHGGRAIGVAPEGILMSRATRDPAVREGRLCVISEFHPKQKWQAGLAMARNRTLAGMSRALVVADCVGEGGTTNQVDVHRAAGLPVFVRRGEGEGALVARLVSQQGVMPLSWNAGAVDLSLVFNGPAPASNAPIHPPAPAPAPAPTPVQQESPQELQKLIVERRQELAEIEGLASRCRAQIASLEARLRATLAVEVVPAAPADAPSLLWMVREPEAPPYSATEPPTQASLEDRLLSVVQAAESPLSVAEIAAALGVPEARVRSAAKAQVAAGRIEGVKEGRAVKYVVTKALGLFTPSTS